MWVRRFACMQALLSKHTASLESLLAAIGRKRPKQFGMAVLRQVDAF